MSTEDIVTRLRTPEVWHTQVSEDWEPYETVARTKGIESIKLEAADEIERLRETLAAVLAGFVMVPRNLTPQMSARVERAIETCMNRDNDRPAAEFVYAALLASAPSVPQEKP